VGWIFWNYGGRKAPHPPPTSCFYTSRIFGPISKSSHMNILSSAGLLLKCYNDGDEKIVKCDENLGYRTCFIRYNEKGGITGRGCSTKDKVYYKECETNSYGEGTEKFCYCNFYLCNRASANSLYAFPLLCLLPLWFLKAFL